MRRIEYERRSKRTEIAVDEDGNCRDIDCACHGATRNRASLELHADWRDGAFCRSDVSATMDEVCISSDGVVRGRRIRWALQTHDCHLRQLPDQRGYRNVDRRGTKNFAVGWRDTSWCAAAL